jgi:hypothetical protein
LSSIPPISTKQSPLILTELILNTQKNPTTYDIGNSGTDLGQTQKYGGDQVKPVNGILILSSE